MRSLVVLLLFLSSPAWALRARDLVSDGELLYTQLTANDPQRDDVGLRLADLFFDAAVEIDGDAKAGKKEMDLADAYRRKALRLYEERLPKKTGVVSARIKFQLARLYALNNRMNDAIRFWRELANHNPDVTMRRESALLLAEQLEIATSASLIEEAGDLYTLALPLAEKQSLKSYILYRLAWTQFRRAQTDQAVATLQKSLALSSDAREQDNLLKDLVLFLSRQDHPIERQLGVLKSYEQKLKKPSLMDQLAEAYNTADRKTEYVAVLKLLNEKSMRLERTIALLDAEHDSLRSAAVEKMLKQIRSLALSGKKFSDEASEKRSRDQLNRLVVLWDGQRRAKGGEFERLFDDGVDTMLVVFPGSEDAQKAFGGWLAAHTANEARLKQVDHWLELTAPLKNKKLEVSLKQFKLEYARQVKNWAVVLEVSQDLEKLQNGPTRESRYQKAKALYELKDYEAALPIFMDLSRSDSGGDLVKFSQDLTLDILAIQKRYDDIIRLTQSWNLSPVRKAELAVIGEKARFERAVDRQDQESLADFTRFCLNKKFLPNSCANARSLAARLRDQDKLITVLRVEGDEAELARQLEISGRFLESAKLLEKSAKTNLEVLKVALLYELQGAMPERNRVLKGLAGRLRTQKDTLSPDEQNLIFLTFQDAGLVDEYMLHLPLSEEYKRRVADVLYLRSKSPTARKMLLEACSGPDLPGWEKAHLENLKDLYLKQRNIKFVGSRSQANFNSRVSLLKQLSARADCFIKGSDLSLRVATAAKVSGAFAEFAQQIQATPIPSGLDEATVVEVKAQIAGMAQPFQDSAEQWKKLAAAEVPEREFGEKWAFEPLQTQTQTQTPKSVAFDWKPLLAEVQKNPFARPAQENLKAHFEEKGYKRLSSYMNGRLQGLEVQ